MYVTEYYKKDENGNKIVVARKTSLFMAPAEAEMTSEMEEKAARTKKIVKTVGIVTLCAATAGVGGAIYLSKKDEDEPAGAIEGPTSDIYIPSEESGTNDTIE